MTSRSSFITLERLRAADWAGDWNSVCRRARSRRLLMREYLRRAALWAQAYASEAAWPFFDVTDYVDLNLCLPSELATELDGLLSSIASYSIQKTCLGAVRLAWLRDQKSATLPDLADLYEPLILFYERGGEFLSDNAGFLELTGVAIKPLSLRDNLRTTPFLTLGNATLDALDAEGRITYYAAAGAHGPVLRQRLLKGGTERRDEVFTWSLRWEPTEELQRSEREQNNAAYTQIGDIEAARFIEAAIEKRPGPEQ